MNLDIHFFKCECGEMNIIGGYQQADWSQTEDGAYYIATCSKCGNTERRDYYEPGESSGSGI